MTKAEELALYYDRLTTIFSSIEMLEFLARHPDVEGWHLMPNGTLRGYTSWLNWERKQAGIPIDISDLPGSPDYQLNLDGDGYQFRQVLNLDVAGQPVQLEFTVDQNYSELDKIELTNLGYMKQEFSPGSRYISVTCSR